MFLSYTVRIRDLNGVVCVFGDGDPAFWIGEYLNFVQLCLSALLSSERYDFENKVEFDLEIRHLQKTT
jgi:hypothetical protein